MKKVLITMLSLGTLSANAGGYVNGGLGYEMKKSSSKGFEDKKEEFKQKGLLLTFGAGQMQDLENNLFLGYGFDLGMSMAKKKKDQENEVIEVKSNLFMDTYLSFGYKINDAISTYAKLGVNLSQTSYIRKLNGEIVENKYLTDIGLMYGIGMNYMVNAKGAVYAEILMKNAKSDFGREGKTKTMPALTVGYRYFF
jgi:hypothetical protein